MSRKIVVPGVEFTGPRLRRDTQQRDGTLMLIEPAHELYPWAPGVPADASSVPNVASDTASTLMGVPEALTNPTFRSSGMASPTGILERTPKGALHAAVRRTPSTTAKAAIRLPEAFKEYLRAHPNNAIYHSLWMRSTREVATPQPYTLFIARDDQNLMHTYWYASNMRPDSTRPNLLGSFSPGRPAPAAGISLQAIAARGFYTGTDSTVIPAAAAFRADLGWGQSFKTPDGYNGPSGFDGWALYRYQCEDLTVSGISFAEALAQDQAALAAALAADGRYAADSYTNPTTLDS